MTKITMELCVTSYVAQGMTLSVITTVTTMGKKPVWTAGWGRSVSKQYASRDVTYSMVDVLFLENASAIMAGRATIVTSVFHTLAASMGVAACRGSVTARPTGADCSVIKI